MVGVVPIQPAQEGAAEEGREKKWTTTSSFLVYLFLANCILAIVVSRGS